MMRCVSDSGARPQRHGAFPRTAGRPVRSTDESWHPPAGVGALHLEHTRERQSATRTAITPWQPAATGLSTAFAGGTVSRCTRPHDSRRNLVLDCSLTCASQGYGSPEALEHAWETLESCWRPADLIQLLATTSSRRHTKGSLIDERHLPS
jgi:hypothetical protein